MFRGEILIEHTHSYATVVMSVAATKQKLRMPSASMISAVGQRVDSVTVVNSAVSQNLSPTVIGLVKVTVLRTDVMTQM